MFDDVTTETLVRAAVSENTRACITMVQLRPALGTWGTFFACSIEAPGHESVTGVQAGCSVYVCVCGCVDVWACIYVYMFICVGVDVGVGVGALAGARARAREREREKECYKNLA